MSSQVRVLSFEAVPLADTSASNQASGAQVNVYVLASSDSIARERAEREMRDAGWEPSGSLESSPVTAASFEASSDGLAYYEQCLVDGIVIVMHMWRQQH